MIIDTAARYRDNASKNGIVYSVVETKQYTVRLQDDSGNFLTVSYHRFENDFTKVR